MTDEESEPDQAPSGQEAAQPQPAQTSSVQEGPLLEDGTPLPNSAVAAPADLTELAPDGPHRLAPMFDKRPAILKNPAEIPERGQHADLEEAAFASLTEDLQWVNKEVPSAEETEARRQRHELYKKKKRRERRQKKAIKITAAVLVGLVLLVAFWFRYTFGGMERMPSVHGQAGANTPGENFLIVGTNPSEPVQRNSRRSWKDDFATSDLTMVVHVTRDKKQMYVISIPHDAAVPIPGHGIGKLADAYSFGGAKLYVRAVEEMTGARLDRVFTLDLNAFREMTDIFDGVVVTAPTALCDESAGPRRVDGQAALEYIALRSCMPGKDLDRVARQQSLMKALMRGAVDGGTITHPLRLNKLLRAGASNSTLENGYGYPGILSTLWSFRHLRTSTTTFLTVPVADQPLFDVNGIDYVRLDDADSADLWEALRQDRLGEYLLLSGIATS